MAVPLRSPDRPRLPPDAWSAYRVPLSDAFQTSTVVLLQEGFVSRWLRRGRGVANVLPAQEVRDLRARLADTNGQDTTKTLEASFVKVAHQFSVNRGIGYAAWRDASV